MKDETNLLGQDREIYHVFLYKFSILSSQPYKKIPLNFFPLNFSYTTFKYLVATN